MDSPTPSLKALIKTLQTHNSFAVSLRSQDPLLDNWTINDDYFLYYNNALYVLNDPAVWKQLLYAHHDNPFTGHTGCDCTLHLI